MQGGVDTGGSSSSEGEQRWAYRVPRGRKPRPSPELMALVVQLAPSEIAALLQGPRLHRVLADSQDSGQDSSGDDWNEDRWAGLASQGEVWHDHQVDEGGEGGDGAEERWRWHERQSPPKKPAARGASRSRSGSPTKGARQQLPQQHGSEVHGRPFDVVARERAEREALLQAKEARRKQQLALLAKVKKQQEARAKYLKQVQEAKRVEELQKAEAAAVEAVERAEMAAQAARKWRQEKDAMLKAAKAKAAKAVAAEAETPAADNAQAKGDGGGVQAGREPQAYQKPWRRGMKRKAKENVDSTCADNKKPPSAKDGAAAGLEGLEMAVEGGGPEVEKTQARSTAVVREGVKEWMEARRKEKAALRKAAREEAARLELVKKAKVLKAVNTGNKWIARSAKANRSAAGSAPVFQPPPWDEDFMGSEDESPIVKPRHINGPSVAPAHRDRNLLPKPILKLDDGRRRTKLAVPGEVLSHPPEDGSMFDPPPIDCAFGEWCDAKSVQSEASGGEADSPKQRPPSRRKTVLFADDPDGPSNPSKEDIEQAASPGQGSETGESHGSRGSDEQQAPTGILRRGRSRVEEADQEAADADSTARMASGHNLVGNDTKISRNTSGVSMDSDAVHHGFVDVDSDSVTNTLPPRKPSLRNQLLKSAPSAVFVRESSASFSGEATNLEGPARGSQLGEGSRTEAQQSRGGRRAVKKAAGVKGEGGRARSRSSRASSATSPRSSSSPPRRARGSRGSPPSQRRRSPQPPQQRQSRATPEPPGGRELAGAGRDGSSSLSKFQELLHATGAATSPEVVAAVGSTEAAEEALLDDRRRKQILLTIAKSIADRIDSLHAAPLAAPISSWGPELHGPSANQATEAQQLAASSEDSFDELTLLKDIEPLPRWPSARSKTAKQSLANHENSSLAEPFRVVSSPSSPSCSVSSDSSRAILDAGISEHPPGTSVHRSSTEVGATGGRENPAEARPPLSTIQLPLEPGILYTPGQHDLTIIEAFFRRRSESTSAPRSSRAAPSPLPLPRPLEPAMQQRQPLGVASAEEEIPQEPVASSLNSTAGAAGPVPAAQHKSAVGNEPRWGRAAVVLSAESSLQQEEEEFLAAQRGAESSPSPSRGSMAAQPTGGERPSEERSPTPGISPVSPSVVSPGKDAETSLDMQAVAELPVLPRSTASRDPGTRGGSPLDQGRASPDHAAVPGGRLRRSPAELSSIMSAELARLGDVEGAAQELAALEYARRLAQAQKQAERAARALEGQRATAQQEAQLRAIQDQQADRMAQQVERVRQEIRSESLHQIQDITKLFMQNLNYNKLQHADTQTKEVADMEVQTVPAEPPLAPIPPRIPKAGVWRVAGSISESIVSEDHAATPREESSLLEEVPSRSTASISDEVEASATAATDMKTESQVYTDDFDPGTASAATGTAVGTATGLGASSASALAQMYSVESSAARTVAGDSISVDGAPGSPGHGISQELRDKFVVQAEGRAELEEEAIREGLKSAKEKAAVQLRQLQSQKSRLAQGRPRQSIQQQMRLVEMQLAMEEADAEQRVAAVRRDLQRQLLAWEQLTGAYLAGDLGPGGEDVLRLRLLERRASDLTREDISPRGHVVASSSGVSEEVEADGSGASSALSVSVVSAESYVSVSRESSPATEAGKSAPASEVDDSGASGYSDDFDSVADDVEDEYFEDRDGRGTATSVIADERPDRAPSASTAIGGVGSAGSSSDERLLAELSKRSEQLQRERRKLAIQAKQAEVARLEAEIKDLRDSPGRPPAAKRPAPIPRRHQDDSLISEEGDIADHHSDTPTAEDDTVEDLASAVGSPVPSVAAGHRKHHEEAGSIPDEVNSSATRSLLHQSSILESVVDYTQEFEQVEGSGDSFAQYVPDTDPQSQTLKMPGSGPRSALTPLAQTEDIEDFDDTRQTPRPGGALVEASEASVAYSEDFGGLLGEDSVKSSIGKRQSSSRSGLGATMAYTEDFEEAESAAAGSVSELPLSSAAVPQSKSMASASYSEDFDAPREERSERAQSGLGASMAYTEDFDEAEDQDDGDEMAGGGIFGNVMDASDIGAMLMEDDPLEEVEATLQPDVSDSFSMSAGDLADADKSLELEGDGGHEGLSEDDKDVSYEMSMDGGPATEPASLVESWSDLPSDSVGMGDGSKKHEELDVVAPQEGDGGAGEQGHWAGEELGQATEAEADGRARKPAHPPTASQSDLDYTEDFETSKLSVSGDGKEPSQQAETPPRMPPPELSPLRPQVSISPSASIEIAEDSIMEDLGESFELEAHQQMLDIMTKPRDSAPGPSPLGQEVRPETRHSAEIPPPSPSEHYTTEFEPDAGGNTAEWEAEDGGTPKSASALPAAASPKSTTTAYTTEFEPDDLPDSPIPELPPDLLSESGDETEHLDRVSDLESLPEDDLVPGEMEGSEASGPIEAPEPDANDFQDAQREAAEAEKKEHDAETLAEGLMQQLLQEALTEMCDARACYDTRLELRAVRFAPQPIQLRAKTTADASDASEPESPRSPRASATSLKNLPPLKTPKHGIDEPMSPSGSSPPTSPFERGLQSQRSVGSVTASEIDSEGDEAAVRSDRKYVGRYVADVMRSFLTNQDQSGDSMDFEAGREVLGLHGFIELERTRPEVNEAQHIYNKLLYDAVNEVLSSTDQNILAMGMVNRRAGRVLTERVEKRVLDMVFYTQAVDNESSSAAMAAHVLGSEAPELEKHRLNTDLQQQDIVHEVADLIFDDLASELASLLMEMDSA